MSQTVVDATIALASEHQTMLMLIASRSQVDQAELGSGYVENWTASSLAEYVHKRDPEGYIILSRDHGGPWQHPKETDASEEEAMYSACSSYAEDIAAGFDIIHLDTSHDAKGKMAPTEKALARLPRLWSFCLDEAQKCNRSIVFEVGTEDQDSLSHNVESTFETLDAILQIAKKENFPPPLFVVAQTGTKVMESRNVGLLDIFNRIEGALPSELLIPRLVSGCNQRRILLKQHNTDYLSDDTLQQHPWLGIHAANVAPEFGVGESRAFAYMLRAYQLHKELDCFLSQAYASKKWEKWLSPNSKLSDTEKALLAGHYIFASESFKENRLRAAEQIRRKGGEMERHIFTTVKALILRYMRTFRLTEAPWKK